MHVRGGIHAKLRKNIVSCCVLSVGLLCLPHAAVASQSQCGVESASSTLEITNAAVCLGKQGSPILAAAYLLSYARNGIWDIRQGRAAHVLTTLYQALGLPRQAADIAKDAAAGWSRQQRERFWLRQARLWFSRGKFHQAEKALVGWVEVASSNRAAKREMLLALALMEQGNYAGASDVLEPHRGAPNRNLIARYNYAVSLIYQEGRTAEGLALLDRVGLFKADSSFHQYIRDRANLQLGWYWLQRRQGGTARAMFARIPLHSPYANRALLGLGWAQLIPDGEPQTARFHRQLGCSGIQVPGRRSRTLLFYTLYSGNCEPWQTYLFQVVHEFAYHPAATGREIYLSALKYWTELAERDRSEPAVQEALLAAGYAYAAYGDFVRAEQAYLRALKAYQEESENLTRLRKALNDGGNRSLALIKQPEYRDYFIQLRASRDFTLLRQMLEAAPRYRKRLMRLTRTPALPTASAPTRLHSLQARAGRLQRRLYHLKAALQGAITQMLVEAVDRNLRRLGHYSDAATTALLSIYNRAQPGGAQTP